MSVSSYTYIVLSDGVLPSHTDVVVVDDLPLLKQTATKSIIQISITKYAYIVQCKQLNRINITY